MKVVLTLSGGMDSAVLLYYLRSAGDDVLCLSVDYGQRHRKEIQAAARIAQINQCQYRLADLSAVRPLLAGSSQTGDLDVPEGHYAEESMKQTVVPNRNMILLALAGAWAVSQKADAVAYAAHAGDHAIYPDCRSEFADAMEVALRLCDWRKVELLRPFVNSTKSDLVRLGTDLGVPFGMTWSCYKGLEKHCGKCGTCVERREAFELAGVTDPTKYDI